MSYWYQKEYPVGELYKVFGDVSTILKEEIFDCDMRYPCGGETGKENDVRVLATVLRRLCVSVALDTALSSPDNLVVNPGGFTWKHGVREDETYCLCRKTTQGWLFEMGGKDMDTAVNFGWQKLSYEHPLANTTTTVGPSRHLGLCRNE